VVLGGGYRKIFLTGALDFFYNKCINLFRMDSQVAGIMSSLIPQIKDAQVAIFLFVLGGMVGLALVVFAIRWGWSRIWNTAFGRTDLESKYYVDVLGDKWSPQRYQNILQVDQKKQDEDLAKH
jgi:hypothetical protein